MSVKLESIIISAGALHSPFWCYHSNGYAVDCNIHELFSQLPIMYVFLISAFLLDWIR